MFFLCLAVQRSFIAQVVGVPTLSGCLYGHKHKQYGYNILKILQHLSTRYGQINAQQLKAKENGIIFQFVMDTSQLSQD